MKRIAVIGSPGSGKSTLARELGARTGIAVVHLDQLYWQPGWKPHPDPPAFRSTVDRIVAGDSWILDGEFFGSAGPTRFERADTVVLFDLPTGLCLYRALKRWWTYRGDARPDLAPGIRRRWFLSFITTF